MSTGPDSTAERTSRVLARLTSWTGALLLVLAGAGTLACALMGILVVRLRDGVGSWIPLVIASVAALLVVALAWDRRLLVADLRRVRAARTVDAPSGGLVPGSRARGTVADIDEGGRAARLETARAEYRMRRDTPMPRVEAAQRAAREYLGGTVNSPWLGRDMRATITLFLAVAATIPLTATTTIIATIVALTS